MDGEGQMQFLKNLSKALAVQFGSQCEVLIHDLTHGSDNTVIAIENGHVTGRQVGHGASSIVLRSLQDPLAAEDHYGYLTQTQDGRLLRSSSVYLRDQDGRAVALLCINYDFTELRHATSVLERFMEASPAEAAEIETITSSVNDMLERLIIASAVFVGKPVALMNKEDKVKAVRYLNERGAFLIRGSGDKVTKFLDISKYTLYNYLGNYSNESDAKEVTESNESD